ncbi:MAG: radical SAM family heme chaperone HemW [Polyangiaceae bacterium]
MQRQMRDLSEGSRPDPTPVAPRTASVYVHFPYCLAKCPYCDFVSYAPEGGRSAIDHRGYADAVLRELGQRAPRLEGRTLGSVFFGGGTPSLWEASELGRVLVGSLGALPAASGEAVEVTVECNPTSIDEDRCRALADVGVGRVSIGVQSMRDERLRFLGRLHDARGGAEAVKGALKSGMPRVSGDLIFGLPGQSPEEAQREAIELAELGLSHVSAYQLTIEPGTRFGELARRGRLPLADDGATAEAFLAIDEAMSARGFVHYEISNYARPGAEARHNVGYWRGEEYLGLGCGAYGFALDEADPTRGERWRNDPSPAAYVSGDPTVSATREPLDAATMLRERIMLGLRMREGVDLDAAANDLGIEGGGWTEDRSREAAALEARGRISRHGSRVRIPQAAWLWADDTAARLM